MPLTPALSRGERGQNRGPFEPPGGRESEPGDRRGVRDGRLDRSRRVDLGAGGRSSPGSRGRPGAGRGRRPPSILPGAVRRPSGRLTRRRGAAEAAVPNPRRRGSNPARASVPAENRTRQVFGRKFVQIGPAAMPARECRGRASGTAGMRIMKVLGRGVASWEGVGRPVDASQNTPRLPARQPSTRWIFREIPRPRPPPGARRHRYAIAGFHGTRCLNFIKSGTPFARGCGWPWIRGWRSAGRRRGVASGCDGISTRSRGGRAGAAPAPRAPAAVR